MSDDDISGRSFAANPIIAAPGALPAAWAAQLVRCVVDENVNLPDTAELSYRDPDHEFLVKTGITIGTRLTVSVSTVRDRGRTLLFSGEVTALELDTDETGSYTVVRASSRAHRLLRGRKVAAFRNMTAGDIIRKVAKDAGLSVGRVQADPITYPHRSQNAISDWDLLQILAEEHGAMVTMDEQDRLEFIRLAPAAGAPAPTTSSIRNQFVLEYGRNLVALRAGVTSADQYSTVEVRGWDVKTKRPVVGRSQALTSTTVVPGMSPAQAASAFGGTPELLVTDTPYGTQAETATVAKALAASTSAGFGELEAVALGNPKLRAGVPVALGNVGPAFAGRYTVTAAHHVLEPGAGYRTTVFVSASSDRSLAGLVTGGNAPSRGERINGVAIGIVTDTKEPGNKGRGEVRLRFPWLSETYVSDWVRTVQLGGGGVCSPEVDDEVLVGFEQGSLDRPYVLGTLYNGVDQPAKHDIRLIDGTRGTVDRRSIVSRTGNRFELLDKTGGPSGVRLTTGDDKLMVHLDQQRTQITVHSDGTMDIQVKGEITVSGTGVSIDAGRGELTLKGRKVSVDASQGVRVDGGAEAVVKGRVIRLN
ncbi:VgrG-related protein [Actinoalloteichus hymeniacidonis]|uniref:Gp5/Type VI secretion system Vgr protein OB-fold domain-containing protein n=1 Tax=Actinoalloteichus hymeniacidonis TaxID=340345 RepID=A0AAC9HTN4_9PSEU|nr:VgrG-related protein [Actinoalloteichus hymeniacidonis]AOS64295.1 hypothetical protein TL08_17475 [Actinoalloteichus hymeniacidonis]MBB5907637.1 phage protein D [Actinoalloteichus hymeniacidonis]